MKIRLLFAMFVSGMLFAQQPVPPPPKQAAIDGRIVDAQSGKPLEGVAVHLSRQDPGPTSWQMGDPPMPRTQWDTHSDARGTYQFRELDPGQYAVSAMTPGYGIDDLEISVARVQLGAGEIAAGVDFELTREKSVSGKVVDEHGKPVPYVWKALLREKYVDGRKQLVPVAGSGGLTNEQGEFRFAGVWDGPVFLLFTPLQSTLKEFAGIPDTVELREFSTTYYPGVAAVSQATRLELTPGVERTGLETKIVTAPANPVRGRVLDHSGQLARNCAVMLIPEDLVSLPMLSMRIAKAPEGTFEFRDLPEGPYKLVVQFENPRMIHRESITVKRGERLEVRPPKPVRLEAEVISKGARLNSAAVFLSLQADVEGTGSLPSAVPVPGNGAKIAFEAALPGKYRITASVVDPRVPKDSFSVESIWYGARQVTEDPVDITSQPAPIRILVVAGGTGAVTGTVVSNGAAARRVNVLLLSADEIWRLHQRWPKSTWTDQKGRFSIEGLLPGEYLAFAFSKTEEGFWRDGQRFRKFADAAKIVSIAKGASANVRLQVTELPP
jgi:protocatechuate 3,4-dioxygenase beta subunit